jgi:hypothetical protein
MTSCYKDKSNIGLKTINEFTINGIEKNYRDFIYGKDTLKINPNIVSSKKNQEYTYLWYIYKSNITSGILKIDTICHKKNLVYPIKKDENKDIEFISVGNSYVLIFEVKNKETEVIELKKTKFSVLTKMSKGWYILKDNNSATEIDFFYKYDFSKKTQNMLSENSILIHGKPLSLSFLKDLNTGTGVPSTCVVAVTDKNISFIKINDNKGILKEMLDYNTLFKPQPANRSPIAFITQKTGKQFAINDNKLYACDFIYNYSMWGTALTYFGNPVSTPQGGTEYNNLKLSKRFLPFQGKAVFFDKESSSFLYYDRFELKFFPDKIDILNENWEKIGTKILKPNKKLEADIIYAGKKKIIKDRYGIVVNIPNSIAILKERSSQKLLLYHFKFTVKSLRSPVSADPVFKIDTILANHELAKADKYAINKNADFLYYVKNNEIKYYDLNYKQTQLLYTLPAGEKVTYMHHAKYEVRKLLSKEAIDEDHWFNKLVVATYSSGKYKVYLFDILEQNEQKLNNNPIILEGNGRVVDALYISPSLNHASYDSQHN